MRNTLTVLLAAVILLIEGCTSVMAPLGEYVLNRDDQWSDATKFANIQAEVMGDERYTSLAYRGITATVSGLSAETWTYRRVLLVTVNADGGRPIGNLRGENYIVSVVPDGLPLLKQGDLVEVRRGSHQHYLKDSPTPGEGSAVLRLLCPQNGFLSFKEYDMKVACAKTLAWHEPWGEGVRYFDGVLASPSGRPYLKSLKDHTEISFTPYYDDKGNVLPTAVKPAEHPSIVGWLAPKRY